MRTTRVASRVRGPRSAQGTGARSGSTTRSERKALAKATIGVGGTFTDVLILGGDDVIREFKVPTTPEATRRSSASIRDGPILDDSDCRPLK